MLFFSSWALKIERFKSRAISKMEMKEKSLFLKVFGDSPKLRVLDFLVVSDEFDYSMKEIAEKSGVGYSTLRLFWKELVKDKIVIHTRDIGKARLFKLNTENPIVKKFDKMYWEITEVITNQLHSEFKKRVIAKIH